MTSMKEVFVKLHRCDIPVPDVYIKEEEHSDDNNNDDGGGEPVSPFQVFCDQQEPVDECTQNEERTNPASNGTPSQSIKNILEEWEDEADCKMEMKNIKVETQENWNNNEEEKDAPCEAESTSNLIWQGISDCEHRQADLPIVECHHRMYSHTEHSRNLPSTSSINSEEENKVLQSAKVWTEPTNGFVHNVNNSSPGSAESDSEKSSTEEYEVFTDSQEITRKKRKKEMYDMVVAMNKKLAKREDEFDVVGQRIAFKLRKLPAETAMVAEKLINDILFECENGNVSSHTRLCVNHVLQTNGIYKTVKNSLEL